MSEGSVVVTIGLDGRIHIPEDARRDLGLEPGTEIEIRRLEDRRDAGRAPSEEWVSEVLEDVLAADEPTYAWRRGG